MKSNAKRTELLAPAGSYDAACAAFAYGADAVYLGLSTLSARAEAVNFTPDELASITAYAHALASRRAVFVAVNTLVRDDELEGVIASLEAAGEAGVDGVIIQDFAVFALARRLFPSLPLHASTQMCVHNLEGALAMKELGFSRVVFARELTFAEIADIAAKADVETEVFIHGALCYGYSGICLFSALSAGRSGNRGRCAYCCRERFSSPDGRHASFPFSMRDLRLGESVRDLRDAGVTSLKIEGRMKAPLYVAAATHLYRLILDGTASDEEIAEAADDLRTVFSRPVTRLFFDGRQGDSSGNVDASTVGHRGTPIGYVEAVRADRGKRYLRFTTARAIELHDGIQVDLPGRPYGFPVDKLRRAADGKSAITCPSGSRVEIELPADAPVLPGHARVFCSSSQAVHRKFAFSRPRLADAHAATPLDVAVALAPGGITASATVNGSTASVTEPATLSPANKPEATRGAVEKAFGRMGESRWSLKSLALDDPLSLYAPASILNETRRKLCAALDAAFEEGKAACHAQRLAALGEALAAELPLDERIPTGLSVKVRLSAPPETISCAEVVLALTVESCRDSDGLLAATQAWRMRNPHVRIALPNIVRGDEAQAVANAVVKLSASGVRDWECPDYASLHLVRRLCGDGASVTADSSFYAFNKVAALTLRELGVAAAVAPAECDDAQLESLCAAAPGFFIAPLRLRPPLFISETKPVVPWEEGESYDLQDRRGNNYTVEHYDGRWYTRQASPIDRPPPASAIRFRRDLTDR